MSGAERLQSGDRFARDRQVRGTSGEHGDEPAGRRQRTDDHGAPDRVSHHRLGLEPAWRPAQHTVGAPGGQRWEPGFAVALRGEQAQRLLLGLALGEDDFGHGGASPAIGIQPGDTADVSRWLRC